MSKTRTASAAPPFSARRRRRRLSSRPGFPCQSALSSFFSPPDRPALKSVPKAEAGSERKNHCGLPRCFPHGSVAIRLKCRKLRADDEKIKDFLSRLSSPSRRFRPESGVFMGRRSPCQSTFRTFSRLSARRPWRQKNDARRLRGVAVIGMSLTGGYLAFPAPGARPNRPAASIKPRQAWPKAHGLPRPSPPLIR